jgi:hypothetical protein
MKTEEALFLFRKIMRDTRYTLNCGIDYVSTRFFAKSRPYSGLLLEDKHDFPQFTLQNKRIQGIRLMMQGIFEGLHEDWVKKCTALYLTIARFGIGACAESVTLFLYEALFKTTIYQSGYFLNIALYDQDFKPKNHNFLIYVPHLLQIPRLPQKGESFLDWLGSIDKTTGEEMILIDPWRFMTEALTPQVKHELIKAINWSRLTTTAACAKMNVAGDLSLVQETWDDEIDETYQKFCESPQLMAFFPVSKKIEYKPILIELLNNSCASSLTFSARVKPTYFVDAVAELTTLEMVERAKGFIDEFGHGCIIADRDGNIKLVLEDINHEDLMMGRRIQDFYREKCLSAGMVENHHCG